MSLELIKILSRFSVNRSSACVLQKHSSSIHVLTVLSPYSDDRITITGYDIGYVTGMAIHRNKDGLGDNWKLDKVTIVTDELVIRNWAHEGKQFLWVKKMPEPIRHCHERMKSRRAYRLYIRLVPEANPSQVIFRHGDPIFCGYCYHGRYEDVSEERESACK